VLSVPECGYSAAMIDSKTLAIAVEHHQAGRLREAERLYREIVAIDPSQVDAWHYLGMISHQSGNHDAAIKHINRAISLKPDFAAGHYNLGLVFQTQDKRNEAIACYQRALELDPDLADACNNVGLLFKGMGHVETAIEYYRRALGLNSSFVAALINLGAAFADTDKLDDALACLERVLQLEPENAAAHNNLGNVFVEKGNFAEAATCYGRAAELAPLDAQTQHNLGKCLHLQGKLEDAAASLRRSLQLQPRSSGVIATLGSVLRDQGHFDDAIACYRKAVEINPNFPEAHNNLGSILLDQGKLDEAIACFHEALRHDPCLPEAEHNLASVCRGLGRFDETAKRTQRVLEQKPDFADAHVNQSFVKLIRGDFEHGWEEYEWRWKTRLQPVRSFSQPIWNGESLQGESVLIQSEQGFGDIIHFIRYASLVKRAGAIVLVECPGRLINLLSSCKGIDRLVPSEESVPDFSMHVPMMSLPRIFKTSLRTIPADVPYLFADAALTDLWRTRLTSVCGFRIGTNWRGRGNNAQSRQRDIPVELFASLGKVSDVRLISLQKGDAGTRSEVGIQRSESSDAGTARPTIVDLGKFDMERGAFVDTAAIMMNLDLVITSDTSVAHLAGALGVPVWVALPFVPDWRWMLERSDSPWYPTMRLFRQKKIGDWEGVFEEIWAALAERVQSSKFKVQG